MDNQLEKVSNADIMNQYNNAIIYTKEYMNSRVKIIEDNIIYYRELEYPNKNSFNYMMDLVNRFSLEFDKNGFYLIGDSLDMKNRADSQDRNEIIARYKGLTNLKHLSVVVNENRIVRGLIRFVFRKSVVKSVSTHKNYEEALAHIKKLKTK